MWMNHHALVLMLLLRVLAVNSLHIMLDVVCLSLATLVLSRHEELMLMVRLVCIHRGVLDLEFG